MTILSDTIFSIAISAIFNWKILNSLEINKQYDFYTKKKKCFISIYI